MISMTFGVNEDSRTKCLHFVTKMRSGTNLCSADYAICFVRISSNTTIAAVYLFCTKLSNAVSGRLMPFL